MKDKILAALSHVDDPDLHKDIVTLGMVENLVVDGLHARFDLVLTTPACPMKDMIVNACRNAIRVMVDPDLKVEINVGSRVSSTRQEMSVLPGVKNIVAVASGKGGVGKSTVAAGLALALRERGASVGLLDADIYGPSIPTIFGVSEAPEMLVKDGKNWMLPIEKQGIKLLSIGFLTAPDQAVMWRGPMISSAFKQFVNDVLWGELDYLVIDMPPGTGDLQITLAQTVPLTGLVFVCTPQELARADARRAISMFKTPAIAKPILGLVENMSYFEPEDMPGKRYHIFGEGGGRALATEMELPFLGELPLLSGMQRDSDKGSINTAAAYFEPFMTMASELARQVSIVNAAGPASEK